MHQDQINVIGLELLQRLVHSLRNVLVVHVIDLGGQEEGFTGHTSVLDTVSDFGFVSVSLGAGGDAGMSTRIAQSGRGRKDGNVRINVLVAGQQGGLDSLSDLVGLGLPCSETDSGDFTPSVELESESVRGRVVRLSDTEAKTCGGDRRAG